MTTTFTADTVNAWFNDRIQRLEEDEFAVGDLASTYYECLREDLTHFTPGDNVYTITEYLYDDSSETHSWLNNNLNGDEVVSLLFPLDELDDDEGIWMTGGIQENLSISERIRRTVIDHFTDNLAEKLMAEWNNDFGIDMEDSEVTE